MSVALLDVNVLIALFDRSHLHHKDAHGWFADNRHSGWATCPITANGFLRVVSSPANPAVLVTLTEAARALRVMCAADDHEFWPDDVSLLDDGLFHALAIGGHKKLTDAYLLGLAVRHGGRLVTFDRTIPLKAVVGATPDHLCLLGS